MNRRLTYAVVLVLLAGLCLWGCRQREPYAGKYRSINNTPEITLELKSSGEGVWSSGDMPVPFRWEVKDDKIWLHTKGGGVLIGTPAGDEVVMDMSGDLRPCCPVDKIVRFKRIPEGS